MDLFDISVIVAVYESWTLRFVLNSLERQDFTGRFEVIICDDGSTTDLRTVVQGAANRGRYDIRYVWHPRNGRRAAVSRNNGIRLARGSLLVFLDGDCLVPETLLTRHSRAHSKDKLLVCGSRSLTYIQPERLSEISTGLHGSLTEHLKNIESVSIRAYQQGVFRSMPWLGCIASNMSVRRSPHVYFDESFTGWGCEETELACRLHLTEGYDIVPDLDSQVYSIESEPITDYTFVRPREHAAIVEFLRNVLRLRSLYSAERMTVLLDAFRQFDVDTATSEWHRLPAKVAMKRSRSEAVALVDSWFAKHADPLST